MPDNFNGCNFIDFAEDTPTPSFAQDSTRVARRIKIAWADAQENFPRAFLGFAKVATDAASGKKYISRQTPHPYPKMANTKGNLYLYCTAISRIKGVLPEGADADKVQSYTLGEAECTYNVLTWPVLENNDVLGDGVWNAIPDEGAFATNPSKRRYVTRLAKQAGKIISLPQGTMRVVDGSAQGIPFKLGIPLRQTSAMVVYVHHLLPEDAVPWKAAQAAANTINNADFDVWSAQTLLFESMDVKTMVSPLGDKIADCQFSFKWLPNVNRTTTQMPDDAAPPAANSIARGHNYILATVKLGASKVTDYFLTTGSGTAGGQRLYATSNFADLFRPDQ